MRKYVIYLISYSKIKYNIYLCEYLFIRVFTYRNLSYGLDTYRNIVDLK